jgi:type IV pilus assembly protein PilV
MLKYSLNLPSIPASRASKKSLARVALSRPRKAAQAGIAMVEAMVAIVIFSIGILGIVGMQARSTQMMTDSVFRAQAAQVATELISEMWTSDPSRRDQQFSSASGGIRYLQWRSRFQGGANGLPGSVANPPLVVVQTIQVPQPTVPPSNYTMTNVTITVFWQRSGAPVSQYVTSARILEPQS